MATIQADKINGVLKANTSEVNGVSLSSISSLVGVGRSLLSTTYDFNNQSIVTSATQNGWSPSSGHSSWINGPAAVKNYKNGGKWSSSSLTPINGEPSLAGAANITGWKVDSNATGSAYTGPSGAHNGSGGHSTLYNTRYVYTEVSSSRHSYHHIMRTLPSISQQRWGIRAMT